MGIPSSQLPASLRREVRELPESKLYAPVKAWLVAQGYRVFAEVWGHDVVAVKDRHLVVVELKMSCSWRVIQQAYLAGIFADAAYAAVPRMPRACSLEQCRKRGIGLLLLDEHVRVVLPAINQSYGPSHDNKLILLQQRQPDDDRVGGLPQMAGDGNAQRVKRLVDAYRLEHPQATWREIFRDVPNHYAHACSMRQAMRGVIVREDWKVKREAV